MSHFAKRSNAARRGAAQRSQHAIDAANRASKAVGFSRAPICPTRPKFAWRRKASRTPRTRRLWRTADIKISTIEHLLAALWTRGITHCRIAVDGDEVPILDGSAKPWCELLESAGTRELKTKRARYGLREAVAVHDGQGCVLGLPHSSLRVSTSVAYATWWDSHQCVDCEVSPASFARELAPARTFTLEAWIEPLRERGLIRGGSPDNALILGDSGPSAPWRLPQELARHKALDVLGDIAILFGADGGDLCAHLIATKAGHELHRLWMHECLRRDALVRLL